MKLSNVLVGSKVQVKDASGHFHSVNAGKIGTVIRVEGAAYSGNLTVHVDFGCDYSDTDWGNHKDLRRVDKVRKYIPKVGDRVVTTSNASTFYKLGQVGTVKSLHGTNAHVQFDDASQGTWYVDYTNMRKYKG